MFSRRRSRHVPDGIALEPGERPLAVAEGSDTVLTATSHRLVTTDGREWPWHTVERAFWDGDAEALTVIVTRDGGGQRRHAVVLTAPGRLVDVVREQVTASVVIDRHIAVVGRRGVRVIGRRRADGSLSWLARLDAGLRGDDPDTKQRIDEAVAVVRAEVE